MKIGRKIPQFLITILSLIALMLMVSIFFMATRSAKRPAFYNIQKAPEMSVSLVARRGEEPVPTSFCPDKSDITIGLKIDYLERNRELVTTYTADFSGDYMVKNPYPRAADISFFFAFPKTARTISNTQLLIGKEEPSGVHYASNGIRFSSSFGPNEIKNILVTYSAEGLDNYIYALSHDRRIEELNLRMALSGAHDIEFPSTTLLPTTKRKTEDGWDLSWNFKKLITRNNIGVELPLRLGRQSEFAILGYLAPLFLALFLGSLRLSTRSENISLGIHHYLLLGVCFFLFYPLIFTLSKHLSITWTFILSMSVISLLIVSFLKKVTTTGFALKRGLAFLMIFLFLCTLAVLISPMMNLLFVLGGLILVSIFMWIAMQTKTGPAMVTTPPELEIDETRDDGLSELLTGLRPEPGVEPTAGEGVTLEEIKGFCTFCGHDIAAGFEFCPSCGRNVLKSIVCHGCGGNLCIECAKDFRFCPECGRGLELATKKQRNQKDESNSSPQSSVVS